MFHDRLIQAIALAVMIVSATVCGSALPRLNRTIEKHVLRYTNVAVEGAPPIVALGTAIGALRGIIVDWLWIKVHLMQQKGLYYEVMADSDLITRLQPRFAAVWAFHGHNMAYNISVVHNTEEERWEWVKAGIDLVRNKGLRYNPNDLPLHRELAFFFAHKIEGVSDDAHLYYKRELAREWHELLGEPPPEREARIAWIKTVADAPTTLSEAERRTPGVHQLVERLKLDLEPFKDRFQFALDRTLLAAWSRWEALRGQSAYARVFGLEERRREDDPVYVAFDQIASDPEYREAWEALLAHVRKRVLLDDYNMDPQLMYEFTRDTGPIDWRHGSAHALYWSLRGSRFGEERVAVSEDDVYRIVNNDRSKLQAMQDLARYGRVSFDPFSADWVARFPDPRWIGVIDRYWEKLSLRHEETRGPGLDMFLAFHENFLSSAVRELYRQGEFELAQHWLDRLNKLYGPGGSNPKPDYKYALPLENFARQELQGEIGFQPHIAISEAYAALRYGYLIGLGHDRPDILLRARAYVADIIAYFKGNEYNNFVTKMGSARLGALIADLENASITVLAQLLVDPTVALPDRLLVYRSAPDDLKVRVYDLVRPMLEAQMQVHPVGQLFRGVLPPPPGLEEYRLARAEEAARRKAEQEQRQSVPGEVERK